jgi:hypothetical protein
MLRRRSKSARARTLIGFVGVMGLLFGLTPAEPAVAWNRSRAAVPEAATPVSRVQEPAAAASRRWSAGCRIRPHSSSTTGR